MRIYLIPVITIIIASLVLIQAGEAEGIQDPDSLWIDLSIDLASLNEGTMEITISTIEESNGSYPADFEFPSGAVRYDNDNLKRVLNALEPYFKTNETFLSAFLDSDGGPVLGDTVYSLFMGDEGFSLTFSAEFQFENGGSTREYEIMRFVNGIEYPKVDRSDTLSVGRRNEFINEVRLCRVRIYIDVPDDCSIDLQFEDDGHERTTNGESVDISTNLHEVREEGDGVRISRIGFLSAGMLFPIVLVITILEIITIAVIWWRNRFRGTGLILPLLSIVIIPFHLVLFFNPHINIYGTHDSFLFASIVISIGTIAASLFVNPKHEKVKTRTYEEEKEASFKMPKVIYATKNVYIRSKDENGGIDAYEILDVTRSMSTKDIKDRYKKQVLRFHPDKFHDSTDDMIELAERETGRLNRAYDMIMKERGEKE